MTVKFYTLLYIDIDETRQLAGLKRKGRERLAIYLHLTALLDKSLQANNEWCGPLTVLTNDAAMICEIGRDLNYTFTIEEIDFDLAVPKGIRFYSAHYKIDAFRHLGNKPADEYSVLLDNDVVAIRPFPKEFFEITSSGTPMCYHLPMGDIARVMGDCRKIKPDAKVLQWTGGEIWGGRNDFFATLYKVSLRISELYFPKVNDNLFHVGDEMITSLAFSELKENGLKYIDARTLSLLYRYWGMHEKETLSHFNPVLAHLPADKVWLTSLSLKDSFNSREFVKKYTKHWRLYKIVKKIKTLAGR